METPQPSHLDETDPAKADVADIREEADREIDAYGDAAAELVMLCPEERWEEFLRLTGAPDDAGEARYRGVLFRKAAVTAITVQEGF